MIDINRIPPTKRWLLATRVLSTLPLAYNWFFRDSVGRAFPHLETVIFKEVARDAIEIAEEFKLPCNSPSEIAEALGIVSTILYGPQLKGNLLHSDDTSALIEITSCPLVAVAEKIGVEPDRAYTVCIAYSSAFVEALNPSFALQNTSSICRGSPACEIYIKKRTS